MRQAPAIVDRMVIWETTGGTPGVQARINWGDSSFAALEPCPTGWQVRFFRGLADLGPYSVSTMARGMEWLRRFGQHHEKSLAYRNHPRPMQQTGYQALTFARQTTYKKHRRKASDFAS